MSDFLESYYKVYGNTTVAVVENSVRVQLPTFDNFTVEVESPRFEEVEESLGVSGKLYLYSGEFLTLLTSELLGLDHGRFVEAIVAWMLTDLMRDKAQSYDSWDHATSLRIETLVYLRQAMPGSYPGNGDALLKDDLQWALDLDNIKLNNHGVFVLRSLLLASKCLPLNAFMDLETRVLKAFTTKNGCDFGTCVRIGWMVCRKFTII